MKGGRVLWVLVVLGVPAPLVAQEAPLDELVPSEGTEVQPGPGPMLAPESAVTPGPEPASESTTLPTAEPSPASDDRALGLQALADGDHAAAAEHFERAVAHDEQDAHLHALLGQARWLSGRYGEAIASLRLAVSLAPDVEAYRVWLKQAVRAAQAQARNELETGESPSPAPRFERRKRWYGWQTLLADATSVLFIVGGANAEAAPVTVAGILGAAVATPIVHTVNGEPGKGARSVGLRLSGGLIGLLGVAGCIGSGDLCPLVYVGAGLLIVTPVIDMATAFTEVDVRVDEEASARPQAPGPSLRVFAAPTPRSRGFVAGIGGSL